MSVLNKEIFPKFRTVVVPVKKRFDKVPNSRRYCSVPKCKNFAGNGISLHYFPKEMGLRLTWLRVCGIKKNYTKFMNVCSEHFRKEDFNSDMQRRRLRSTAIPTKFLPKTKEVENSTESSQASMENYQRDDCTDFSASVPSTSMEECHPVLSGPSNVEEEVDCSPNLLVPLFSDSKFTEPSTSPSTEGFHTCDRDIEDFENSFTTSSDDSIASEMDVFNFDREIAALALLELSNVAEAVTEIEETPPIVVESVVEKVKMCVESGTQVFSMWCIDSAIKTDDEMKAFFGVTFDMLESIMGAFSIADKNNDSAHRHSLRNRVLVTLCKLRLNLSFICVGVLFGVTGRTCGRYFTATLPVLASILKEAMYWPEKEEILINMPCCFDSYRKTRVVLDCTEVAVERPKCLECRLKLYSHYKSTVTVKILVGVTPAGLISFISQVFGGRASDKGIVLQSGILDKLMPFADAVMVDKGFRIENECSDRYVDLIRPPFASSKVEQMSAKDASETVSIAAARVHVERAIQQIKIFHILQSRITWPMAHDIGDIMTVICGLVNLSSPILSDERF